MSIKNDYKRYLRLVVDCDKLISENPSGGYLSPTEWVSTIIHDENNPYGLYIVDRIFKEGGARDKLEFYSSPYFKGLKNRGQ